jgi:hypothetical protein
MRIPKLLLTVCAMSVCAGFISARAEDTPEQAAARAALEARMNALNAQGSGGQMIFVPATNSQPTDASTAVPALAPQATNTPATPEAQAKAQAAVEQKISDLNQPQQTQSPPVIYVPALPQTNDVNAAEEALHKKMAELNAQENAGQKYSSGMIFVPANTTQPTPEAQAQAQAALEQRMSQLNQQEMATRKPVAKKEVEPVAVQPTQPTQPTETATSADVSYPGKDLGLKPIEAPSMPVSADIEAQLQELNAKYMANQISPEEYHKRRAEILAKP